MLLLHAPRANLPCKFARVLHAVLHGLLHEMLGSLHDTSTMPLAVATEVPGWVSTELGDGMSERMNQNRSGMHLARLKQCLLLYVNAKFMDGVSFTSLEQQVVDFGVSVRSVNGAWGAVREALKSLGPMGKSEAAEVATALVNGLAYVPRAADSLMAQAATIRDPPLVTTI